MTYILAIDQGTTSSRGIIFDADMNIVATAQQEFDQHFPQSGWVEHVVDDLWNTTVATARGSIAKAGIQASDIKGIGITNQRETTVVWDKNTGDAVHNAIVWQDRRTSAMCQDLKKDNFEAEITEKTGLLLDPYFSGTKLKWILDNVDGARAKADAGNLLFGTVDSYLIWKLTNGAAHVTDATNAVVAEGNFSGRLLFQGAGAGDKPTASAVVADIVDIARGEMGPAFAMATGDLQAMQRAPSGHRRSKVYLRMMVADKPGVLAEIAAAMRDADVSIESLIQTEVEDGSALIAMVTHECREQAITDTLETLSGSDSLLGEPMVMHLLRD